MRGPRAAQHDIVLVVKEVRRVQRVQGHGLEALVAPQRGARPLPDAAHLGLAGEDVAAGRHRHGVPVLEADVGAGEVEEQLRGAGLRGCGRGGWRGFLDAVVDEVTKGQGC